MNNRFWITILGALAAAGAPAYAQKFYPDDPLTKEPPPFQTESANYRALNFFYSTIENTFKAPGERHPVRGVIPAQGVSTLGEVLDGPWFVNRHGKKRLSTEELLRGPGDQDPPSRQAPWRVLTVRKYDVRPGLLIHDADGTLYLLRFDPPDRLELATGAGMIGSRLYHALGYWVPETYLVHFDRSGLVAAPEGEDINAVGVAQKLMEDDIDLFLKSLPRDPARGYRAVAIKAPKGAKLVGPYEFFGLRRDDPNDIVPHEHRRDLRGVHVISAWVNNNWVSAVQSQDVLIQENGIYFMRHYIVDFFNTLGSGIEQMKRAREGNEPLFDMGTTARNILGFGIWAPAWQRARYPGIRAVGRFEYEAFDPGKWTPNYEAAALANHLPDDDYWAAKQILAFTDDDIRTIVKVARHSDQRAEEWIARCLIERRNKIGRHFLDAVLPLDNFRLEAGQLKFDDLAVRLGYRPAQDYTVEWFTVNNFSGDLNAIFNQRGFTVPQRAAEAGAGSYFAAKISGSTPGKTLTVYLRKEKAGLTVVGVERDWPGKVLAEATQTQGKALASQYPQLSPRDKELFDGYTTDYNRKTGFGVTPEQAYGALSISERTTFSAITNALANSKLTDESGNSLGVALDLVAGIERIAGQYYGRQGDEQFRLYCTLKPNARDVLEKSREFHFGHENTVYHVGYPFSYRQEGNVPNIQFSVSEDGSRADIDVDYRSSKLPQAMFNGHLTSANSDVRAGNNYERHTNRWAGLVNWWQELFGNLRQPGKETEVDDMLAKEPPEPPTPLPPDRPAGAHVGEVWEAAQEFLTDWLVRRKYDESLEWVSDQALACARLDDGTDPRTLPPAEARLRLREIMKVVSEEMGKFDSLTEAVDAVIPWRKAFRVVKQPFEGDFTIVEAPDAFAEFFKCESRSKERQDSSLEGDLKYGTYYGSVFRFKVGNSRGGVIAGLWANESGNWRLVAWEVLGQ